MAREKPYRPPTSVTLAGVHVRRELVEWLAGQLEDEPAGDRLRAGIRAGHGGSYGSLRRCGEHARLRHSALCSGPAAGGPAG